MFTDKLIAFADYKVGFSHSNKTLTQGVNNIAATNL
jgi:hypothetical protein